MTKVSIVNVVATAALQQKIDLNDLVQFIEILYDTEIYGGRVAYFKSKDMKGRVTIFPSGKLISVGTKSEDEAIKELTVTKDFLVKKHLIQPISLQPKLQNLVAVGNLESAVNLESLVERWRVIYEPEQFPGAILKMNDPFNATVLVFASGKFVITGLKSSGQVEPVVKALEKILKASLF